MKKLWNMFLCWKYGQDVPYIEFIQELKIDETGFFSCKKKCKRCGSIQEAPMGNF